MKSFSEFVVGKKYYNSSVDYKYTCRAVADDFVVLLSKQHVVGKLHEEE